jgi:hypothetical protein
MSYTAKLSSCVFAVNSKHGTVWMFVIACHKSRSKYGELINSLEVDDINRHVLCCSEHQMEEQDLLHLALPGCVLGSRFWRQNVQRAGVCSFVGEDCISAK